MGVLVLAEQSKGKISGGTLAAIGAAKKVGGEVDVLVAGNFGGKHDFAKQVSKLEGVTRVIFADKPELGHDIAEVYAPLLADLAKHTKASHVIIGASAFGKSVLPRLSAVLDSSPLQDVSAINAPDTFVRPIYAGNVLCTIKSSDAIKTLSVRSTAFDKAQPKDKEAPVVPLPSEVSVKPFPNTQWVSDDVKDSGRPDLQTSPIVISGGRGLKAPENFSLINQLADKIGAAVGASRAAVDAGWVPNDLQIGQTGKVVAPELYVAVGISGAIQHLAGMKDSKMIVAINKDPEAPIFTVADAGIVADLFQVVPELTKLLEKK